ncbi:MAG: integrase [Planctomycetota bacterium]
MREFLAVKSPNALPTAPVFPRSVCNQTRMDDFRRAGIERVTDAGHADLHALRGTFATRLAERGVPPAKMQKLMRHGTIELTMRYYVSLSLDSLEAGLDLLPGVESEGPGEDSAVS